MEEPTPPLHSAAKTSPDDTEKPTKPHGWLHTLKGYKWLIGGTCALTGIGAGIYYDFIPGKEQITDASNGLQEWFSSNEWFQNTTNWFQSWFRSDDETTSENNGTSHWSFADGNGNDQCLRSDDSAAEQCLPQIDPANPCADLSKCQVAIVPPPKCAVPDGFFSSPELSETDGSDGPGG